MEFLMANWVFIVVIAAAVAVGGYALYVFIKKPTPEKLLKVREWLLYAVAKAEKKLGSGTGQIKLRYVYDMFIAKFPYLVKVIPFSMFSSLVDEALDKFKVMLESNSKLKNYIEQ